MWAHSGWPVINIFWKAPAAATRSGIYAQPCLQEPLVIAQPASPARPIPAHHRSANKGEAKAGTTGRSPRKLAYPNRRSTYPARRPGGRAWGRLRPRCERSAGEGLPWSWLRRREGWRSAAGGREGCQGFAAGVAASQSDHYDSSSGKNKQAFMTSSPTHAVARHAQGSLTPKLSASTISCTSTPPRRISASFSSRPCKWAPECVWGPNLAQLCLLIELRHPCSARSPVALITRFSAVSIAIAAICCLDVTAW